ALITMKMAKAMIRNWITALRNSPMPIATAGTSSPAALIVASRRVITQSLKSTPPIISPIGGMITLSTKAVTMLPNAAPMTTPTARSTTLPRIANSLNSEAMLILWTPDRWDWPGESKDRLPVPGSRQWRQDNAVQRQQIVQPRAAAVARLQRGNARRRAHEHQVAGAQAVEPRELVQDLVDAPDQLVQPRGLPKLAVDLQRQRAWFQRARFGGAHQLAHRRGVVEALGDVPWQPSGLGLRLQVAPGQVQADGVAEHQPWRVA